MSTVGWCGLGDDQGFPPSRSAISGELSSLPKVGGLLQHIPIVTGSPRAAAWLP
jgi:hypothetical protein